MTLSDARKFVTPSPGEDWNALAARVLPGEAADAAIQRLKSWNLHLFARMPPGQFLGCDVIFVEPPRAAGPTRAPMPRAAGPTRAPMPRAAGPTRAPMPRAAGSTRAPMPRGADRGGA